MLRTWMALPALYMKDRNAVARRLKVVIVRDRPSAGGGIVNYYDAVAPHVDADVVFSDVGRPHSYYQRTDSVLLRFNLIRLLWDWTSLAVTIIRRRPDIVHVNPGMDPQARRSLRRDAVNILIARVLLRRVLVFWRGWEAGYPGRLEFPTGNDSVLCKIYKLAAVHVVLACRFKADLERWGFQCPIHVETTVASDEVTSAFRMTDIESRPRTNLLYLSRIEADKGVFELIHAYAALKKQRRDLTLTIAGNGSDLNAAKELVRALGLDDVAFPGFVSGHNKVEQYRKASVFCFLSSHGEGMPNAVLEAMSMGLPLVCSDSGGLRDILTNGVHGFVVKQRVSCQDGHKFDPLEVAHRIAEVLDDEEQYRRMARANRDCAMERFDARKVAKRLTEIYLAAT